MRIERQIEYEAKDDAEAIQVARDRLGRDAVILSSRRVKLGGFLGFFKRDSMMVTAGILVPDREDHVKQSRERMVAFQHLLDVKRAVSEGGRSGTPFSRIEFLRAFVGLFPVSTLYTYSHRREGLFIQYQAAFFRGFPASCEGSRRDKGYSGQSPRAA